MPARKPPQTDARRNFRLPLADFYLVVVLEGSERPVPAALLEVSMGGAKLLTQHPLRQGKKHEIVLEFEGGLLSLPCRVAWERKRLLKRLYGVEFLGKRFDALARQALLAYNDKARSLAALRKVLDSIPDGKKKKETNRHKR